MQTFLEANGMSTYQGSDYAIAGAGRYVRFTNLTDYGDPDYMGLSEIRFVVPEPASLSLIGVAAIGLLSRKRRV